CLTTPRDQSMARSVSISSSAAFFGFRCGLASGGPSGLPLAAAFTSSSSSRRAGTSMVFLHLGYPLQPRNLPRRPVRMIIGLPHSSQSMSVAMFLTSAAGGRPLSARIFAAISCALADASLSSGSNASTCLAASPSSFLTILVERHLGKLEQPRNGPRLESRSSIGLPHFSHGTLVSIGLGLGGSGLPSLSRLMIVEQAGSPFSF